MKRFLTLGAVLFALTVQAQNDNISYEERFVVNPVNLDDAPVFAGCSEDATTKRLKCFEEEFQNYVETNMKYPETEFNNEEEETVMIRYVLGVEGKPQEIKIIKGKNENFKAEALRLVESMPYIRPGRINGVNVATYHTAKIKFKID